MRFHRLIAVAVTVTLAACGGGGGGSTGPGAIAPSGPSTTGAGGGNGAGASGASQTVQLNIHVPGAAVATSATKRAPQFVAASTQGVGVVVYSHSDTAHQNPLGTQDTNVAPGSAACGGASGPRTCSISIPAPPGYDDFVFSTFDQPPSSSTTFPPGAHLLATGTVSNQNIQIASANVVNVTLSGTIAYLSSTPYSYAFPAGTGAYTYTYEINAFDGGNNVIIGPYVDANGNPNPITVSVVESGGSGFAKISTDGGAYGTSAVVNGSSDTLSVSYSGGGSAGYFAKLQAAAAAGQTVAGYMDPLFVSSTSPNFTPLTTPGGSATLNLNTVGQSATINVAEANATTINLFDSNCNGVAVIGTPGPSGPTQSFTITGSTGGGTCSVNIGFTNAAYNINVTSVGNTSANVAVPGATLAYLANGTAGVAIDTETGSTAGTVTTATSADYIALDDNADLWVQTSPPTGQTSTGAITLYTPGGSSYPPAYTKSTRTYAPSDPNHLTFIQASGAGELVAIEYNAPMGGTPVTTFDEWDPGASGAPSRTITEPGINGSSIIFGGVDHAGHLITAEYVTCGSNTCIQYSVFPPDSATGSRTVSETLVAQANQANFYPNYLAVGPDGTLYVTEWSFYNPDPYEGLYIYPPSGPEKYVTFGLNGANGVDLDGQGNIYVVNNNSVYNSGSASLDTAHDVVVFSPDGATFLRSILVPVANPIPITVASDGTSFISAYANAALGLTGGTYVAATNQYNASQISSIGAADVVLWNGARETTSNARSTLSTGSGTAHGGGIGLRRRR